MRKLIFADMRQNLKLFWGTFLAIFVSTSIICACMNLVSSSTAVFEYSHRFDAVDIMVLANQNTTITYTESDGDLESESEEISERVPLSDKQLSELKSKYSTVEDYTFNLQVSGIKGNKMGGHNYSSVALSGFKLSGQEPGKNQVVIDEDLALQNNLQIGDSLTIKTNQGVSSYTISGVVSSNNEEIYNAQNYIFFNDDTAKEQSLGCMSVGIVTNHVDDTVQQLEKDGYTVYSGSDRYRAELTSIINNDIALMVIFITMGSVCLVISLFVIGGTLQFSIKNRYRTLALLRVTGLKKSQVKAFIAWQTAILGLFAGTLGAVCGIPTAQAIIKAYQQFNIVDESFVVNHSFFWDAVVVIGVVLLGMIVADITANKPLSVPPASAIKNENEFTGKTSAFGVVTGLVLVAGGFSILRFTPMTKGIGIGMGFCATSVFLAAAMCLTPIIMKFFNLVLSLIMKRFDKSLGRVASANVQMKASKFAVASVSIAILMSMGTVMMLNNFTYIKSTADEQFTFSKNYKYVATNQYAYDLSQAEIMGIKNVKLVRQNEKKLSSVNAMAMFGGLPQLDIVSSNANVSGTTVWVSDSMRGINEGDSFNCWLPNGEEITFTVGGIFKTRGITDETSSLVIDYSTIESSFYDARLSSVYSNTPLSGSQVNTKSYYQSTTSYSIQLAASILLGAIAILLSVVALFNTFAVIMSVRTKEFNGLKLIGAKKTQIFRMTFLEILVVTATGLMIGLAILVSVIGTYSLANVGWFDYTVNARVFYGSIILATVLSFIAGIVPSIITVGKIKRQFRVE